MVFVTGENGNLGGHGYGLTQEIHCEDTITSQPIYKASLDTN